MVRLSIIILIVGLQFVGCRTIPLTPEERIERFYK